MSNGNSKLLNRNCFVCDTNNGIDKLLSKVPYMFPLYSKTSIYEHTLIKCLECGNNYINPTVSNELLSNYYASQTSYEISDTQSDILDSYELKSLQQERFILDNVKVKDMTLLDFGCATAYTLNRFKESSNELIGFDTSKECAEIAKNKYNINVYTKFTDIVNYKYDLVMLSHVLEHLIDPEEVLNNLVKLMNDDAYVYIEVPYIESFVDLNNDEIFGHISFEHLNYFNKINLSNLMKKLGFIEIKIEIKDNDDGTMPNYPVILSLWQLTSNKEVKFDNAFSASFESYINEEKEKMAAFQVNIYEKIASKKIVIYGTGTHTYRLLALCPELKDNIVGFSDGNNKKYTESCFYDFPCKNIENYHNDDYEAILISSKASENDIYEILSYKVEKEIIRIYE